VAEPAVPPVPVLVLSGTVGAGKTTVLHEASALLVERGVPHLCVDVDALSYTFPRPADDPFGQRVALANLEAVWRTARQAGATRALLARVVEARADLDGFRRAIPGAEITIVRVVAPAPVVDERLAGREVGAGLDWHRHRAVELAGILDRAAVEDATVANGGRPVRAVATDALVAAGWLDA